MTYRPELYDAVTPRSLQGDVEWYCGKAKESGESLTHLILVATSAGPISVETADVSTDADLREYFRDVWPRVFVSNDKHWPLFESLQFPADAYTAAFTREFPEYDLREQIAGLRVPTLLVVGNRDWYCAQMEWLAAHKCDLVRPRRRRPFSVHRSGRAIQAAGRCVH